MGPTAVLASSREGTSWARWCWRDVCEMARNPSVRTLVAKNLKFGLGQLAQELFPRRFSGALSEMRRYVPSLDWGQVLTSRPHPTLLPWLERPLRRAGVRAQALTLAGNLEEDFVIEVQHKIGRSGGSESASEESTPAMIMHLRNAPSPAATSSLAIAQRVADRAEKAFHW